jgi:hypothetical protein
MRRRFPAWPVLVLALLAATFCKSSSTTPSDTPKDDPSFSGDIQAIFSQSCAVSSCHNSSASGGLTLTNGQAYANLVNVASTGEPTKVRVIPNDAPNSYLVIKLEGRQTVGVKMPAGGSLSSTQIQNIKNWIAKGAKNN